MDSQKAMFCEICNSCQQLKCSLIDLVEYLWLPDLLDVVEYLWLPGLLDVVEYLWLPGLLDLLPLSQQ